MSTLLDCCAGCNNAGEKPYLTGKYVIYHSAHAYRQTEGKGKSRDIRTNRVPRSWEGAELKSHLYLDLHPLWKLPE